MTLEQMEARLSALEKPKNKVILVDEDNPNLRMEISLKNGKLYHKLKESKEVEISVTVQEFDYYEK